MATSRPRFAIVLCLCVGISSAAAWGSVTDLGAAGEYLLLACGAPDGARSGTMILGSASEPLGNVGARGTLLVGPASHFGGNLDYGSFAQLAPPVQIDGLYRKLSSSQWGTIRSDLLAASQWAAGLSGVQRGDITASLVIDSEADRFTVVNINGGIALGAGEKLTLRGQAGDKFVINFTGGLDLSAGSGIVLDGVRGEDVLFNMHGGSVYLSPIARMERAELNGVFLAPERFWIIGDGMDIDARILVSGMQANLQTVSPPSIPEPASLAAIAVGVLLFPPRRRSQ